jgi:acetyltransferase-like isoleucine patch superfamily enzyme
MRDFCWLWRNRERATTPDRFARVIVKRALLLAPLLRILFRAQWLRIRGSDIGILTSVGRAEFGGTLSNLKIGRECALGRCSLMLHDRVVIGDRVVINDGARLITATHSLLDPKWSTRTAPIRIGDYAWIATDAVILPGVSIGRGAVVGAGAVVHQDVCDYAVVSGNPATNRGKLRTTGLAYSPVLLTAPFEAWVGSGRRTGA